VKKMKAWVAKKMGHVVVKKKKKKMGRGTYLLRS
jgi:predicted RNA-binding protein YlxR (DUF448 family)